MNIIFLDVDGVLNSLNKLISVYNETHKPHSGFSYPFDENCLENLKLLVQATNSKIVITSTWRKSKEGINILLNNLKKYNLDTEVIGYTPNLSTSRELEIKQFLSLLNQQPNFIILDDDYDFKELIQYLIKTDIQIGLSKKNVEDGIKKLIKSPEKITF